MKLHDIMQNAQYATEVSSKEVEALHRMVESEAFDRFPGSREQQARFEQGDYQGWFPPASDNRFGAFVRATETYEAAWRRVANEIACTPAYDQAVKEFGVKETTEQVHDWFRGSREAVQEMRMQAEAKAAYAIDEKMGRAGSMPDLAKMFPSHVRMVEKYSESGDGGWAGGGPDSWASWNEFHGITEAGEAAIVAVKAGARPAEAMEAALKDEEAKRAAARKAAGIKLSNEATARMTAEESKRAEWKALEVIRDLMRPIDTRGRTPWERRASKTYEKDEIEMRKRLEAATAVQLITDSVAVLRNAAIQKMAAEVTILQNAGAKAKRSEELWAKFQNGTFVEEEAKELLESKWLTRSEEAHVHDYLNGLLLED